ncbi:MAG: hypothetical protein JWM41_680 [Gemmatimonadetes bacterium]|nr:hypothetical protein [Gemmatimonadota bacterium]
MSPKPTVRKKTTSPQVEPKIGGIIESPSDHYQHEKSKRAKRDVPEDELMAAARREYKAMLEAQAAKGKGGRPKKKPATPDSDPGSQDLLGDE